MRLAHRASRAEKALRYARSRHHEDLEEIRGLSALVKEADAQVGLPMGCLSPPSHAETHHHLSPCL